MDVCMKEAKLLFPIDSFYYTYNATLITFVNGTETM